MTNTPQIAPLAWGAFGRPQRIWRYDDEQMTYTEERGYEYG